MKYTFLVPALLLPFISGCSTTNISKLAEALSKDPATVKIRVTTVYGVLDFERSWPTNAAPVQPTIQVPLQMRIESAPTK